MKNEVFIILTLVLFVFFFSWIYSDKAHSGSPDINPNMIASAAIVKTCSEKCFDTYTINQQACAGLAYKTAQDCYKKVLTQYQTCLETCN